MKSKFLLILSNLFFLSGCFGGTSVVHYNMVCTSDKVTSSSTKVDVTYVGATGTTVISFNVKQTSSDLLLKCDFTVDSGTINIDLLYDNSEQVHSSVVQKSSKFDVTLKEYGRYKMTLKLESFTGEYHFNWAK